MPETIETMNLALLRPAEIEVDVVGSSIEGGRSLDGFSTSADIGGGGLVSCKYSGINPGNTVPARLRYVSRMGAMLNGSVARINAPLMLDFIAPVAGGWSGADGLYRLVPHSDGTSFSDGTLYSQPVISAVLTEIAEGGDGILNIKVVEGADLQGGEWFSIEHPTWGHRAYRIRRVISLSETGRIFQVAITGNQVLRYRKRTRAEIALAVFNGMTSRLRKG